MITLHRYGLHWMEGDIGLLVQQEKVDHVLGIEMDFPVTVMKPRQGMRCPHNIHLENAEEHELPDEELVRAMLPVPKNQDDPVLFVEDNPDNRLYLQSLMRLSSSSELLPLWGAKVDYVSASLLTTNLAPLIIYGYDHQYAPRLAKYVEMEGHAPRRLVLLGPRNAVLRPEIKRLDVEPTDLSSVPLERAGAWYLKQRMLGNAD